jgi:hypothetical protein
MMSDRAMYEAQAAGPMEWNGATSAASTLEQSDMTLKR